MQNAQRMPFDESKWGKNSAEQAVIQFSTMDFFDRFVRPASEKGLLRTPLPTPITKQHVRQCSIQLLQAARLQPEDVRTLDDNYGGTIIISKLGLSQVMGYLQYRQESKAAVVIQKTYRGFATRKLLASKAESTGNAPESGDLQQDQIQYLDRYISQMSSLYHSILTAHRSTSSVNSPSKDEIEFMKKLNNEETYRVCLDYLHLIAKKEMNPQEANQRMTMLPGNSALQNTMLLYQEYAPKVTAWISKVLGIQFHPSQDLLFILRSGDIFCRLACTLYNRVDCHLLDKGLEYGIHKIIFFLELCKSLHIKRSLLFQLSDLLVWPDKDLHRKHAIIVLRTVIALEKHARKSGWDGPAMGLKPVASASLGVTSRETMRIPNNSVSPEYNTVPEKNMKTDTSSAPSPDPISKPQPPKNFMPPLNNDLNKNHNTNDFGSGNLSLDRTHLKKPFEQPPPNDPEVQDPSKKSDFSTVSESPRNHDNAGSDSSYESNLKPTRFQAERIDLPLIRSRASQDIDIMPPSLLPSAINDDFRFKNPTDDEYSEPLSAASHSENMMAALHFNESAFMFDDSTIKRDPFVKKVAAVPENRLLIRERAMDEFIISEEIYVKNLSNIVDFLNKIVKDRKRQSAAMPELTEGEKNTMKSQIHSNTPQPNESERAFKFRLENEIEDLQRLFNVLEEILSQHSQLLEKFRTCWNVNSDCMIIGQVISQFASSIQSTYTTYAVVALSGPQKSHLNLNTRGELEKHEFLNRIVKKYVANHLEVEEEKERPSEKNWQWYLKRPIHRLASYPKFFAAIYGDDKVRLHPIIDADNKKLKICNIKFESISEAIGEHLDPKNE